MTIVTLTLKMAYEDTFFVGPLVPQLVDRLREICMEDFQAECCWAPAHTITHIDHPDLDIYSGPAVDTWYRVAEQALGLPPMPPFPTKG